MTTTMNAYYAHESEVGPVFDVAKYSRGKSLRMGLVAIGFASLIGLAATYVWNPDWIVSKPSKVWADAHQETKDLMRQHPQGTKAGVAVAGLFSLLVSVMGMSCLAAAVTGGFYIRVGEGGLSLRMPDGFVGAFQRDILWSDIIKLTVVQVKQIGALSDSAGNLGGELQIQTRDGLNRVLPLDYFAEDAWLIYKRMEESRETRLAELTHD